MDKATLRKLTKSEDVAISIFISVLILIVAGLMIQLANRDDPFIYTNDNPTAYLTGKIKQDEILQQLAQCETGGVAEPDGSIILDDNGKISIGRYQWQIESVQFYAEKLYGIKLSRSEAIALAIDNERSTELTRQVLFSEPNGYRNWLNCSQKHNLKEQINLIKTTSTNRF